VSFLGATAFYLTNSAYSEEKKRAVILTNFAGHWGMIMRGWWVGEGGRI
jgi:hypothetical protein